MNTLLKKCMTALAMVASLAAAAPSQAAPAADLKGKNVVLVHGAFADGSSWDKVIPILEARGLHVVAVQNPLSSLKDDVAATRRTIDQQTGPVVLVGHSWAGVVITEAGNDDKVSSLVYVAAFAPESGQSINDVLKGLPPAPWASELQKDSGGFLTLSENAIIHDFASDLPAAQARVIAATQGPWYAGCLDDKVTQAAWHNKPSSFVITSKDRMIPPQLQAAMAKNIGATVVNVDASHVVMVSQPQKVAAAIIAAAEKAK